MKIEKYDSQKIEKKWQRIWQEKKLYEIDLKDSARPKFYNLAMFIYPSGDKLHIGHAYNYTGSDTFGRFKRMQGFNVFEPMGYDAFGLPAENYAIKHGIHPAKSTKENIDYIRKQLKALGCMYDWSKEINTSSPEYYKWTQWLFLQLYKAGLAYRALAPVNWCPSCKTVLANEQVVDGKCERCDSGVIQKNLKQWFFRITRYADRLLSGYKKIKWPRKTILMQKNWIGKSEGIIINFKGIQERYIDGVAKGTIKEKEYNIPVFTTRPDTLYGVTYLVLAPEHPLVEKLVTPDRKKEVDQYLERTKTLTEKERTSVERQKTGVFTGATAKNPVSDEKIPIWIADYVVLGYGTGAVMGVPAHDQRDFVFAKKYGLEIRQVIAPPKDSKIISMKKQAWEGEGILINSKEFSNLTSQDARIKISDFLESKGWGKREVNFRLRDWLVSRQRFWGAPIPIVYCRECGEVPVPEKDLPIKLPKVKNFIPAKDGKPPLAKVKSFVKTKCPKCKKEAERETETMDCFVCSSWYFLRFLSPHLQDRPFDKSLVRKWFPIDQYNGGAEHSTGHLLYARFITKVLYDLGFIHFDEPFLRLVHQGIILAKDGSKMSKSKGNVVIPDEYIKKYGADTFRLYLMFFAPFEQGGSWSDRGILGARRFLEKVWNLVKRVEKNKKMDIEIKRLFHRTIKKVTQDFNKFKFNTAISSLMILVNKLSEFEKIAEESLELLAKLLAPLTPHFAEEIWEKLGNKESIFNSNWPQYDEKLAQARTVELVIQINGKLRDKINVKADIDQGEAERLALGSEKIKKYLKDKKLKKTIFVRNRLINFVV